MLRGGRASANVGLLNIETSKRGAIQTLFDKIQSGYAGALNELTGDTVRPYLTGVSQDQIRQVMDGLKQWNDSSIGDRVAGIARQAGALGMDASALGLGKDEANGPAVNAAVEQGRQAQVERMRLYFQPIGAGNGVLQLGAQRPGANPASLPPGAQPTNQIPNAQPLLTPVQQAGQTAPARSVVPQQAPAPPQPPGGAGNQSPTKSDKRRPLAPQPVTVAGQQVNVGAAARRVACVPVNSVQQHRERVNQRTLGRRQLHSLLRSASGGANLRIYPERKASYVGCKTSHLAPPARAVDATPEQQTAALEKLTTTNATALQTVGLPVSDTTLYMAHNVGADGAVSLLSTSPTADARTVIGEQAAKNNPLFFRGRPTVATVLQRYADAVGGGAAGPAPNLTPMQREALARRGVDTSAPGPTL